MPPIQFVVDRRENGKTLAAVLKLRYGISWAQAKRLVERRHVKVSGMVETDVARRLKLGKQVELATGSVELRPEDRPKKTTPAKPKPTRPASATAQKRKPREPVSPESNEFGIEIIYSDDAVIVVNKPVGLTTMRHKEEAAEFGARGKSYLPKTLADQLPALLGTPDRSPIAVHRIDRDTSGLVVFARSRAAAEHLGRQFRKHTVDRSYLGLTRGVPREKRVESVLVRDRGDGRRGSSSTENPADGKRAVTLVRVIESWPTGALVECRLETGRTHQIRIHLGETGTPLCGEAVYDRAINGRPLPDHSQANRPMLHAASLGFVHPQTGEFMTWEVAPPQEFTLLLQRFRQQE